MQQWLSNNHLFQIILKPKSQIINMNLNALYLEYKLSKINVLFYLEICSFVFKYLHNSLLSCFENLVLTLTDIVSTYETVVICTVHIDLKSHPAFLKLHRCMYINNVSEEICEQKNCCKILMKV